MVEACLACAMRGCQSFDMLVQDVVQELQLQNQLTAASDAAVAEAEEAAIMSEKAHTQVPAHVEHYLCICMSASLANAGTTC